MNDSKPNLDEIYRKINLFRRDFMVNHLENDFEIFIYMSQELEYKLKVNCDFEDRRFNNLHCNSIMGYRYSIDSRMKDLEFKCVIQKKG